MSSYDSRISLQFYLLDYYTLLDVGRQNIFELV
ncbi:hypothetical protein Vi05172_g12988 [Venturia inaequalis]|nr:hypothetical protein Vi05172_g12988 [Venturia inaequalis]